jgi:hypothetical protein
MLPLDLLRQQVKLENLAAKLGCKVVEKQGSGDDEVVIMTLPDSRDTVKIWPARGQWFIDNFTQGHCIDLVMHIEFLDYKAAEKRVHELCWIHYLPLEDEDAEEKQISADKINWLVEQVLKEPDNCIPYLCQERGIPEEVVKHGIKKRTLGWSNYTNPNIAAGEKFHGGECTSFISYNEGARVAVDHRYYDPKLNGDLKTISLGEKLGNYWCLDPKRVRDAHTIYAVEGPLDALSIEAAFWRKSGTAAIALRGTQNRLDWAQFLGKRIICCFDNDAPKEDKRNPTGPWRRAGAEAEWRIHEDCLAAGVSCLFVDRFDWEEGQDANDVWKANKNSHAFTHMEPWLVPGLIGKFKEGAKGYKSRLFLPNHDFQLYWRYRVKEDFTSMVSIKRDDEGEERESYEDIAGFRVAGLSRVEVASASSVMTGDEDLQPRVQFVALLQSARNGHKLLRRVMEDEQLHNLDHWRKAGPIFKPANFARMLNIFERTIGIGAQSAANFVGLCWLNRKLVVNEGKDCFFTDPAQQCPYNNFIFPRGPVRDASTVMQAYQSTFLQNAAALPLVWVLGAQLKIFLGFWPHMIMQSGKGSGKSTLIKRLERSTGMKMFSGQSVATEFRLLTSVSATSHPVGWEEISARKMDIINRAVSLLQEAYNYTETTRGAALTPFLVSAPVLLAGEDVPVDSLTGKTVRTDLSGKKGPIMPDGLPTFPMYAWINWLAKLGKNRVLDVYQQCYTLCKKMCRARADDSGAQRMITNYSGLLCAWRLLGSFGNWPQHMGNFERDLIAEMNNHIADTSNDREPWIWICETIFDEIAANRYPFPFRFEREDNNSGTPEVLTIRVEQMMRHFSTSVHLREQFAGLPVKTGRVLKKQLKEAGVLTEDGKARHIHSQRMSHMQQLSLTKLSGYGLHPSYQDATNNTNEVNTK